MVEPARLTSSEAREASDADLTLWANRYQKGSGAHAVALAEIQRRSERKRDFKKITVAFVVGAAGLGFYLLRYVF